MRFGTIFLEFLVWVIVLVQIFLLITSILTKDVDMFSLCLVLAIPQYILITIIEDYDRRRFL